LLARLVLALLLASAWMLPPPLGPGEPTPALAATIAVNATGDDTSANGNCTLREAILAASSNAAVDGCVSGAAGADTITLPAGTYDLSLAGGGEHAALTGDLDVTSQITIVGAGASTTVVDAHSIDRVFEVRPGGTLTLVDLTIQGGRSNTNPIGVREGGGIKVGLDGGEGGAGILTLTRVVLQNNSSPTEEGGGFFAENGSSVTIVDSTVRTNSADSGAGGHVRGAGTTLTATGTTFSGNTALTGCCGALRVDFDAVARLTNSTVAGNSARANGGGILVDSGGANSASVTLASSTVAGNVAGTSVPGSGGGLNVGGGSATLRNTILEGNAASNVGPDCAGSVSSDGYNLVGSTAGCTFNATAGDQSGLSALLGVLASNGGNTQTRALTTGSPAVDAGNPAGCTHALGGPLATDQRGLARPQGTRCDIGAYEALRLQIGDVSQNEGNGLDSIFNFAVSLSAGVPAGFPGVTVDYSTAAGGASPATAGSDYTAVAATTLTFGVGESSEVATVTVAGDTTFETDETFLVNLSNASGAVIVDIQALGTILNDDPTPIPPVVTTTGSALAYTEGQGAVVVDPDLTITDPDSPNMSGGFVSITASFQSAEDSLGFTNQNGISGSYDSGTGVLTLSGTATLAHYRTALGSVTYTNTSDAPSSATRTVTFGVLDTSSVGSLPATRQITIAPVNDLPVNTVPGAQSTPANTPRVFSTGNGNRISVADVDAGAGTLRVTLAVTAGTGTLTLGGTTGLSVTGNGTASVEATGTLTSLNDGLQGLTFTPQTNVTGPTTLTVTTNDQGNTGSGGFLQDQDTITITVGGPPTVSVDDPAAVAEGNGGAPNTVVFAVTLSGPSSLTVTVPFSTADQTATGGGSCTTGVDYQTTVGTVTFPPGQTSQPITVPLCGDTGVEPNEMFAVNLGTPTNAGLGDGQGVGTIQNDDTAGTLAFSAATTQVAESAGTVALTVQRTGGAASGVTVQFATANGSATAGQDYATTTGTLTFGAGESSKTIVVSILADGLVEPDETFTVVLSNPIGGTLGTPATATVTISDTTPPPPQTVKPSEDDTDKPRKETDEQRQQRERTNASNRDDYYTEGNVVEVHQDVDPSYVVIGNKDGLQRVILRCGSQCPTIRVGDYLEADGEKINEQLFEATDVAVRRSTR
jgi:CSLREA domain-containing protein